MIKEQKNILQIYGAYFVSVICNFLPSPPLQTFGLLLFIAAFLATYFYRSKSSKDSLIYSHMNYIIKSIWISSLILILGMIFAYLLADHSIIHQTFNNVKQGMLLTEDQLNSLMIDYFSANIYVFIATLSPSFFYLVYRLGKGMVTTRNNQKMATLKNWL